MIDVASADPADTTTGTELNALIAAIEAVSTPMCQSRLIAIVHQPVNSKYDNLARERKKKLVNSYVFQGGLTFVFNDTMYCLITLFCNETILQFNNVTCLLKYEPSLTQPRQKLLNT